MVVRKECLISLTVILLAVVLSWNLESRAEEEVEHKPVVVADFEGDTIPFKTTGAKLFLTRDAAVGKQALEMNYPGDKNSCVFFALPPLSAERVENALYLYLSFWIKGDGGKDLGLAIFEDAPGGDGDIYAGNIPADYPDWKKVILKLGPGGNLGHQNWTGEGETKGRWDFDKLRMVQIHNRSRKAEVMIDQMEISTSLAE